VGVAEVSTEAAIPAAVGFPTTVVEVPSPVGGPPLRKFDSLEINRAIDDAIKKLDADPATAGKPLTVLAMANTEGTVDLSAVYRVSDEWSFVGTLHKERAQRWTGQVMARWTPDW
jgi:hypothetical protein